MSIDLSKHLHFDNVSVAYMNSVIEHEEQQVNDNPDQPNVNIDGYIVSREEIIKYCKDVRDAKLELYKTPQGKVVQLVYELHDALAKFELAKLNSKEPMDLTGLIDLNDYGTEYKVNDHVYAKLNYIMEQLKFIAFDIGWREKNGKIND